MRFLPLIVLSFTMLIMMSACGQKSPAAVAENATPAKSGPTMQQGILPIAYSTEVVEPDLPSPRKEMTAEIDGAEIQINYGSPAVKGRVVWGSLVPFDKVWRTGANEATTFTTSEAIQVADETLPAGTYGLFTLPHEGEWEVIFNQTADQWGAYEYDESKDVLRVNVPPRTVETSQERMEFIVTGSNVVLQWEKLRLPIAVRKS